MIDEIKSSSGKVLSHSDAGQQGQQGVPGQQAGAANYSQQAPAGAEAGAAQQVGAYGQADASGQYAAAGAAQQQYQDYSQMAYGYQNYQGMSGGQAYAGQQQYAQNPYQQYQAAQSTQGLYFDPTQQVGHTGGQIPSTCPPGHQGPYFGTAPQPMPYGPARQKLLPPEAMSRKLFVYGIQDTTEEVFYHYFIRFGQIEDYVVMRDQASGAPKGFGFVVYRELPSAQAVLNQNGFHYMNGKALTCKTYTATGQVQQQQTGYQMGMPAMGQM